jgi:hypothetical protein
MTDRLGRWLFVTLEAARLRADVHPLPALRSWLDSWRGLGAVERGMAHQGLRPSAHALRQSRRARDVLDDRDGALDHERERDWHRLGTQAVARDTPGGVGRAEEGRGVALTCAPIRRALE